MAVQKTSCWRIRVGGNNLNGGGFDPSIAGAGTDYTDQDAAQLTKSDMATSGAGVTTLTSASGGFTSLMVGNCIRIASGTNFTAGYYFITAYNSATSVTLDRSPSASAAGSGGTGRLGGAFATFVNLSNGGSGLGTAAITTPLAGGHKVYIRGAGTDDPAGVDYNFSAGYYQAPAGTNTDGPWALIGYNGRPHISTSNLMIFNCEYWVAENIKWTTAVNSFNNYGAMGQGSRVSAKNVYVNNGGFDCMGLNNNGQIINSRFIGTGTAGTETLPAINTTAYGYQVMGCFINGWRGPGIRASSQSAYIFQNIIKACGLDGILIVNPGSANDGYYGTHIMHNTLDGNLRDGVRVDGLEAFIHLALMANNITSNGAYGLNCNFGSTTANNALNKRMYQGKNNYHGNVTAAYRQISANSDDSAINPEYTNSAIHNYTVGSVALNAISSYPSYPGSVI